MKRHRTLFSLLACLAATVAAITAIAGLTDWLIDTVGSEGRAAIALSNAPWFVGEQSVPAVLPTQSPSRKR